MILHLLLRLSPPAQQREFGADIVEFQLERIARSSRAALPRTWLRIVFDAIVSGLRERLGHVRPAGWKSLEMAQHARGALRAIGRSPGFSTTVLATIALGTAAVLSVFTVVNGVLLRPLPFHKPDRIIQLANGDAAATLSEPELIDLTRDARHFSSIGAYSFTNANVTGGTVDPERVVLARVTSGYFDVLRPSLAMGRNIEAADDRPGAPPVVVLSHALWVRRFGFADSSVIGRSITINGLARTIIGVTPQSFDFPTNATAGYIPYQLNAGAPGERRNHSLRVIARLSANASIAQANEEVQSVLESWRIRYPELYKPERPLVATVESIADRYLGTTRPYLLALLGSVVFVLLIATVNVASLIVVRGEARRKELAIRSALGASSRRLFTQLATEGALLTTAGGVLGVLLAMPMQRVLVGLAPSSIPRLDTVHFDWTSGMIAIALSVASGTMLGVLPVIRTVRSASAGALRDGRTTSRSNGRESRRLRSTLVLIEVALAVVTLSGAGLLIRSLDKLQREDAGFEMENRMLARVVLPSREFGESRAVLAIEQVVQEVQSIPGVRAGGAMAWTPLLDAGGMWSIESDNAPVSTNSEAPLAAPQQVTPGLFDALGIAVIRGRTFESSDHASAPLVTIVNERLARTLWGDTDPIGRRLRMFSKDAPWATVIGVVEDTRVEGLGEQPPPVMYFPHAQASKSAYFASNDMTIVASVTAPTPAMIAAMRDAVRGIGGTIPVPDIRMLDEIAGASIASLRFTTMVLSGFGAFALALAGLGIHGLLAYGVQQRRHEIAVRMALGAANARILRDVVGSGIIYTLAGVAIGLAVSAGAGRLLRSLLYGVGAVDPTTFAAASLALIAVAVVALARPVIATLSVSPTQALRDE